MKTGPSVPVIILIFILISGCARTGTTPQPQQCQWKIQDRTDDRYGIFIMDSDGCNTRQIHGSDIPLSSPAASPDGTRVLFYEQSAGVETTEIAMINMNGSGYRRLTQNDWMDVQPRWSPDGSEILIVSTGGKNAGTDLYVMDLQGNVERQLTDTIGISEAYPDWKCGRIVFTRDYSIWIMHENGSYPVSLTYPPGKGTDVGVQYPLGDYDPNLSPDCKKVAYERLTATGKSVGTTNLGDYDIYIYDISSGSETDISKNSEADLIPKWSADNKLIFVHLSDNLSDLYDIYLMNPDGTGRSKVTLEDPDSFVENGCSWLGVASEKIIFTAEFYE